jgi:hypothetical protein
MEQTDIENVQAHLRNVVVAAITEGRDYSVLCDKAGTHVLALTAENLEIDRNFYSKDYLLLVNVNANGDTEIMDIPTPINPKG